MTKREVLAHICQKANESFQAGQPEVSKMLDEIEMMVVNMEEDTAPRSKEYTPIHKGSPIAYPTWKCGRCGHEDRYKRERCVMCGRRFEDEG